MTDMPFPPIAPFREGRLEREDGVVIHFELSGNPLGRPALYLHGGPGSGLGSGSYRTHFDPARWCLVGIDQRGCGRSRPLAADAPESLATNTAEHLLADIEAIRAHLGIESFVIAGVSWGVTLALAYALAHPERVRALALVAVTTTSRDEIDWITGGVARILPEAFARFDEASNRRAGERPVDAYARRLATGDHDDRLAAARAWLDWEDALIALDPNGGPVSRRFDERAAIGFASLVTHYWSKDGFMPGARAILARIGEIGAIPARLIQGRRDIGSPAVTTHELAQRWPASRLVMVEDEGHGGPRSFALLRSCLLYTSPSPRD